MNDPQNYSRDNDMNALAKGAGDLMAATAGVAGEKVSEAREKFASALDRGKEIYGRIRDQAIDCAQATDEAVNEYPYLAIGITFGVGVLLGHLVSLRGSRNGD